MTGAQQAQRTAAYRWVILVAMCMIGFMTVGTRSTVSSFLKTIIADLGTNRETISFALAVLALLGASLVSFGIAERRYSVRYITPAPSAAGD